MFVNNSCRQSQEKVKSKYLLPAICCEAAKRCGSLIPQLTRNFGNFAANDVVAVAKFK